MTLLDTAVTDFLSKLRVLPKLKCPLYTPSDNGLCNMTRDRPKCPYKGNPELCQAYLETRVNEIEAQERAREWATGGKR